MKELNNWFVYILLCSDQTLYTGITTDLNRRLKAHNNGTGAKYTKTRLPCTIVWSVAVGSKSSALKIEYKIKQLPRKDKQKIITGAELGSILNV